MDNAQQNVAAEGPLEPPVPPPPLPEPLTPDQQQQPPLTPNAVKPQIPVDLPNQTGDAQLQVITDRMDVMIEQLDQMKSSQDMVLWMVPTVVVSAIFLWLVMQWLVVMLRTWFGGKKWFRSWDTPNYTNNSSDNHTATEQTKGD